MYIDKQSFAKICGNCEQVIVYGFGKYNYLEVIMALNLSGDTQATSAPEYIYEHPDLKSSSKMGRFSSYKQPLVDLILTNIKRRREGKELIPLIFIVGNEKEIYDPSEIAKRQESTTKWITYSELRRCFKLISNFGDEITNIAKETLKFVKVIPGENGHRFESVEPFWLDDKWEQAWSARKNQPIDSDKKTNKNYFWRNKLRSLVETPDTPDPPKCPKK